jgi:predicted enzyme related to lactoylglutathione lyase
LAATKKFFSRCFDWQFEDFGPDYTAFTNEGLDGGFFYSQQPLSAEGRGALIVFYSNDLSASLDQVKASGGVITKEIFIFPGGRRFHFVEPSGNEFAVWSDMP